MAFGCLGFYSGAEMRTLGLKVYAFCALVGLSARIDIGGMVFCESLKVLLRR